LSSPYKNGATSGCLSTPTSPGKYQSKPDKPWDFRVLSSALICERQSTNSMAMSNNSFDPKERATNNLRRIYRKYKAIRLNKYLCEIVPKDISRLVCGFLKLLVENSVILVYKVGIRYVTI
jgi:hypothetical protein